MKHLRGNLKDHQQTTTIIITMTSTEGSQRYIRKTQMHTIDVRESEPSDFFKLHINSNDTYSRSIHPNNNCHNLTIEFAQGSAESIQYRIAQCNRYNKKRSHTQLDSRKQVIAFQDRVMTINIKEAQHPLK